MKAKLHPDFRARNGGGDRVGCSGDDGMAKKEETNMKWEKMFGHLEEELEELKEELEEFEERDKWIKEEIERHREQMRNWKPRLLRRDEYAD